MFFLCFQTLMIFSVHFSVVKIDIIRSISGETDTYFAPATTTMKDILSITGDRKDKLYLEDEEIDIFTTAGEVHDRWQQHLSSDLTERTVIPTLKHVSIKRWFCDIGVWGLEKYCRFGGYVDDQEMLQTVEELCVSNRMPVAIGDKI